MYYIIISACLIEPYELRKYQYTCGIRAVQSIVKNAPFPIQIIIVENTGTKTSFLNEFDIPVIYTNSNNELITPNKGRKEWVDIQYVIQQLQIKDDDFIVKITGRYIIENPCPFFDILFQTPKKYEAIIRFGSFLSFGDGEPEPTNDLISGFMGMYSKHYKSIPIPDDFTCIEHLIAKHVCNTIPRERIYTIKKLGIQMCPASNYYTYY
jgi:hypothetical protein